MAGKTHLPEPPPRGVTAIELSNPQLPSIFVPGCFSRSKEAEQREMEARVGIEPTNRGFAVPGLTTWLPRRKKRVKSSVFAPGSTRK